MLAIAARRVVWACLSCATLACTQHSAKGESECLRLQSLRLTNARVVSAVYTAAGHDISPPTILLGIPWFKVPAACRVRLRIAPSVDSDIESEVWMPATEWNGRLWSSGNGGLAGSIDALSMRLGLMRGYATSATDAGHRAKDDDGRWALGHPERVADYGYRAIHETAVQAKALIISFYGRGPEFSYFASGSNGGREALLEAQRYPDDYDGIESDAPALDGTNNIVVGSWLAQQLTKTGGSWFPAAKLPAIAAASLAACDAVDGLKDGLIDDPRRCQPRPDALVCKAAETDSCLTQQQIRSLKAIYEGPGGIDAAGYGYYGYEPGSELNWGDWILGPRPGKSLLAMLSEQFHRYLIYGDPNWTLARFDIAADGPQADRLLGPVYDARDPDLSRFAERGGKLILMHGWGDMALPPRLTLEYYRRVQARMGAETAANFVALYMVPGMAHGFGGNGPNAFGQMIAPPAAASPETNIGKALEAWVEKARPPGAVIAGKYDNDLKALFVADSMVASRTRPLCPFPLVARWRGTGSIDDARNFDCVAPPP
jgi:hypothetical protein